MTCPRNVTGLSGDPNWLKVKRNGPEGGRILWHASTAVNDSLHTRTSHNVPRDHPGIQARRTEEGRVVC